MPSHELFLLYKDKNTKTNTGQHKGNLILIGETNRSGFIIKKIPIHVTVSDDLS